MFSNQWVKPFLRRLIFLLFLLLISCKTADHRSNDVVVGQKTYEQVTDLLKQINVLNEQGKYAQAIPIAEKLQTIVEEDKESKNKAAGICLNVIGGLYTSFGDYEKAEKILTRALNINQKSKNSLVISTSFGLMAKLHISKEDYANALPFAQKSLALREQNLKADDFMVSTSLNTLGEIYLNLHQFEKAEPLLIRAIEIRKKHQNIHSLVISLNNLCYLYYERTDYQIASTLGITALELGEYGLGRDHPRLSETLNILGKISAAKEDFQKAFLYLKRAQSIDFQSIDNMKGFTSEAQKLKYIKKIEENFHVYLSLLLTRLTDSREARLEAMNTLLRRKGIVLEVQKQFQRALVSEDPSLVETFQALSDIRFKLTNLAFSGPRKNSLNEYKQKLSLLKREKEKLERDLSTSSQSYTTYLEKEKANCDSIVSSLKRKKSSALVEFIKIKLYQFQKSESKDWSKFHYFAIILLPENHYDVHVVDLGEGDLIDKNISLLKVNFSNASFSKNSTQKILQLSKSLYRSIFPPIQNVLNGRNHIFISPDGYLNLIPFEILYSPGGKFLIENYTFNYLSSGRDLLGFNMHKGSNNRALIIGDPDFDYADAIDASAGKKSGSNMLGIHFKRLPGTLEEVKTIHSFLGKENSELFTGRQANEKVLMQKNAPKILHLATHGFFLDDFEASSNEAMTFKRGIKKVAQKKALPSNDSFHIENPLLKSGFVLTGANNSMGSDTSEGIITAEKILGMRLQGTQMVVLSACDTGVGKVKSGEGVFGLRRAFSQAGARSLVMSMWSVPDLETKELMVEFYRNLVFNKMNRGQALRKASLKIMKKAKQRYNTINPFYWGAFVFMGET
ncbi:MAG: CHAT domain-containing protein [Desulfobacteraceae bacterium]|nr:CHAT domain-containing protein [Desulfobacteraceae bacterium]